MQTLKRHSVLLVLLILNIIVWAGRVPFAQQSTMVGEYGNLWNSQSIMAGTVSAAFDTKGFPHCTIFGATTVPSTLVIQASADGVNFYGGDILIMAFETYSTGLYMGQRWVRLTSSAATTISGTVQCKL